MMTETRHCTDRIPEWWAEAEAEMIPILLNYNDRLRETMARLAANPWPTIRRKNPFLFCIRGRNTGRTFAETIVDAFASASEETTFGEILEQCALVVARYGRNAVKSATEGIDGEYTKEGARHFLQIKSGPNWGNSNQKKQMHENFRKAKRTVRTNTKGINTPEPVFVEGHMYGRSADRTTDSHRIITGPAFWEELSDWKDCSRAVMALIIRHAGNGLGEIRRDAIESLERTLEAKGIISEGTVNWLELHDIFKEQKKSAKTQKSPPKANTPEDQTKRGPER